MKRYQVVVVGVIFVVVVAVVLFFAVRTSDTTPSTVPQLVTPKSLTPDERGPRPTATRLRDGARQIENAADALAAAEKSLARVESEIASTADAEKRKALERQKVLIEAAIKRLKK
jgi:hypothetical protein